MTTLVNLLMWREQRLTARLRFWCIVMSGTLCTVLLLVASRGVADGQEGQRQRLLLSNERDSLHKIRELAERVNEQAQALASQHNAARESQLRRAQTQRWSRALTALAQTLPSQTWLSLVEINKDEMRVDGFSRDETGIVALKTPPAAGVLRLIRYGALERESSGEWRFSLLFDTGGEHAATP